MKNKKGFTLVELLAIIVILAVLVTIAVPSTISISNKLKVNMYCSKIDTSIETAAKMYGEDRRESFSVDSATGYPTKVLTVKDLVDTGYLKKDQNTAPYVVDPRDKASEDLYNMSFKVYVKYNRVYVGFNDDVKTICGK